VLAFHRWIEGVGDDVVVVASLGESTYWSYPIAFPQPGWWHEVFNSDVYDHWVNPSVASNGSGIDALSPRGRGVGGEGATPPGPEYDSPGQFSRGGRA